MGTNIVILSMVHETGHAHQGLSKSIPSFALPLAYGEEESLLEVCKCTAHLAAPDTCSSQLSHHFKMVCQKRFVRLAKTPDGTYKANSWSILSTHAAYYSPTVGFSNSFNSSCESQYATTHRAIPPFAGIEIPPRLLQTLFSPCIAPCSLP